MARSAQSRSSGLYAVAAALAVLILGGAALAQGATPKPAPKTAPKAAPKPAAKASQPTTVPLPSPNRPTVSTLSADGQLLMVPGRQVRISLINNIPRQAGELRAPVDPILSANRNATPAQWASLDPSELPREPGLVVFTLYVDPARGTKLVVANGLDRPVIYSAILLLTRGGLSAPAPVNTCAVPPGGSAVEYWAGLQVDAILAPRVASTATPICFDAAADQFYAPGTLSPTQAAAAVAQPATPTP